MKFVDTQGRIEKFKIKQEAAKGYSKKKNPPTGGEEKDKKPKTLKEMLHKQ